MRFVVVLLILGQGCASLTAQKVTRISVDSDPSGASVSVDNFGEATTPTTVEIMNAHPAPIRIEKDGYHPHECYVQTSVGPGYVVADAVMCVLLFPIGCISFIDGFGAWNVVETPRCAVTLKREHARAEAE